jgi:hypothetical protein
MGQAGNREAETQEVWVAATESKSQFCADPAKYIITLPKEVGTAVNVLNFCLA